MMAGFGFAPRLSFGGPSDQDMARALAQALGGALIGFGGPPGVGLPQGAAPGTIRPAFGFGGLPMPQMPPGAPESQGIPVEGHPAQQARQGLARERAARGLPQTAYTAGAASPVPLPPVRPPEFGGGDPRADLPAEGAQPVMGQVPQETQGPSFLDRLGAGIHANADFLGSLGVGLLSAPTWAGGLSAGMQMAQRSDAQKAASGLARAEMGLKLRKLQQEQSDLGGNAALLKRAYPTLTDTEARAQASNGAAVTEALRIIRDPNHGTGAPSGFRAVAGGGLEPIPGGPADAATISTQAQARSVERDEPQLVDVLGPNGTTQKQWVRKGQASGQPIGEAKAPAPMVKEFTGPDGVKRPHALDVGTGQWKPIDLGDGSLPSATGNPFATGKFNNDQGKAAGFSDRMFGSERILRDMETVNQGAISGTFGGLLPNVWKSSDRQQLEQAQRDFVNAQLRRESGAAIAKTEFQNAERQYFPQPGDSDVVVQQKRANRQRAISAMGREGGPSYRPQFTFDQDGALVPFQAPQQRGMATAPSRSELEAEARRRGLIR